MASKPASRHAYPHKGRGPVDDVVWQPDTWSAHSAAQAQPQQGRERSLQATVRAGKELRLTGMQVSEEYDDEMSHGQGPSVRLVEHAGLGGS